MNWIIYIYSVGGLILVTGVIAFLFAEFSYRKAMAREYDRRAAVCAGVMIQADYFTEHEPTYLLLKNIAEHAAIPTKSIETIRSEWRADMKAEQDRQNRQDRLKRATGTQRPKPEPRPKANPYPNAVLKSGGARNRRPKGKKG